MTDLTPLTQTRSRRRASRKKADQKILESVKIRMFRQGLGDCFLLTFTNQEGDQHQMLIDCGVLPFSSGGNQRLDLAVDSIMEATNRRINTLVATHEHADHISGFKSAAEYFGRHKTSEKNADRSPAKFDEVWLAWTENPKDPQVVTIREKDNALRLGISAATTAMGLDSAESSAIQDIFDFYYVEPEEGEDEAASERPTGETALGLAGNKRSEFMFSQSMNDIMEDLRLWGGENVIYLEPNDVRELADFGVKVHILGPSRRMRILGGEAPSEGETSHGLKLSQANAFMAAALKTSGGNPDFSALAFGTGEKATDQGMPGAWSQTDIDELYNLSLPFDPSQGIALDEAAGKAPVEKGADSKDQVLDELKLFYRQQYLGVDLTREQVPEMVGAEWRRIDNDWLMMGEYLALQQVSSINNTSLVMAIELIESGKVLLFVGDAEEESWETWETNQANLDELLKKTVVYKVGHHGSTNATRDETLEKMSNNELVALVPVDIERAKGKKWEFPAHRLWLPPQSDPKISRGLLYEKTRGRVLINCGPGCMEEGPIYEKQPALDWPGEISTDPSDNRLWVDYTLRF